MALDQFAREVGDLGKTEAIFLQTNKIMEV
jgi:hypothetical protein